jgi:hypothetical protein
MDGRLSCRTEHAHACSAARPHDCAGRLAMPRLPLHALPAPRPRESNGCVGAPPASRGRSRTPQKRHVSTCVSRTRPLSPPAPPHAHCWQVLRWHQGAVQLLFYKGISFTSFGGKFPTIWHRVYAFDQATYYLQVG